MTEIRQLPAQEQRVETGPVQFGDDWPGVFIRGDEAGWLALMLKDAIQEVAEPMARGALQALQLTLAGCIVGPAAEMVRVGEGESVRTD